MYKYAALTVSLLFFFPMPLWAISLTPFGSYGEGGALHSQMLTIGAGGKVNEVDAFLAIDGMDLNGFAFGTSAQLSMDTLPAGLNYNFTSALSADATDLMLRYTFVNNTGSFLSNIRFLVFLDAEIDEPTNTYFNEYGEVLGITGAGAADADADTWEIDEPGLVFGDIFNHLLNGILDDTNALPSGSPDDVSLTLGFDLGNLAPWATTMVNVHVSEDGDTIGSLALVQRDSDPGSVTVITVSGQSVVAATVPEPATGLLFGGGLMALLALNRCRNRM